MSVIWRKPVLTYAVSVVSLMASVNSVKKVLTLTSALSTEKQCIDRRRDYRTGKTTWDAKRHKQLVGQLTGEMGGAGLLRGKRGCDATLSRVSTVNSCTIASIGRRFVFHHPTTSTPVAFALGPGKLPLNAAPRTFSCLPILNRLE